MYNLSFLNFRIISPNLKETITCTAIREGDEVEWEFAFGRYMASNVASEQAVLLSSLCCSEKPWILAKSLDSTNTYFMRFIIKVNILHLKDVGDESQLDVGYPKT